MACTRFFGSNVSRLEPSFVGPESGLRCVALKFSSVPPETAPMDKLLKLFGLSSDSFWTWVGVIALGLILVRVFLDAATPRRVR